jgi:hypothetical protein
MRPGGTLSSKVPASLEASPPLVRTGDHSLLPADKNLSTMTSRWRCHDDRAARRPNGTRTCHVDHRRFLVLHDSRCSMPGGCAISCLRRHPTSWVATRTLRRIARVVQIVPLTCPSTGAAAGSSRVESAVLSARRCGRPFRHETVRERLSCISSSLKRSRPRVALPTACCAPLRQATERWVGAGRSQLFQMGAASTWGIGFRSLVCGTSTSPPSKKSSEAAAVEAGCPGGGAGRRKGHTHSPAITPLASVPGRACEQAGASVSTRGSGRDGRKAMHARVSYCDSGTPTPP